MDNRDIGSLWEIGLKFGHFKRMEIFLAGILVNMMNVIVVTYPLTTPLKKINKCIAIRSLYPSNF